MWYQSRAQSDMRRVLPKHRISRGSHKGAAEGVGFFLGAELRVPQGCSSSRGAHEVLGQSPLFGHALPALGWHLWMSLGSVPMSSPVALGSVCRSPPGPPLPILPTAAFPPLWHSLLTSGAVKLPGVKKTNQRKEVQLCLQCSGAQVIDFSR